MKIPLLKTTDCNYEIPGRSPFILLVCILLLMPVTVWGASIRVSWNPEKVTPGGVVLVRIVSPVKLFAAEAATGKDRFPLIKGEGGQYVALVGIDMGLKGPTLPVDFSFFPVKGGAPYRIRADLKVRKKEAPQQVQNLSLPTGMVDFSRERLLQVRCDNQTLGSSLATRSRERLWREGFLMPVKGRITTEFGVRRVLNGKQRSPHSGVDIAAKVWTPVKASNGGKVLLAGSLYLSGNTVVVDHGWGMITLYAHLNRIAATKGQLVERSDTVGTVGMTGRATGPHLHFGAFIRGVKVDPLQLIEATQGFLQAEQPHESRKKK